MPNIIGRCGGSSVITSVYVSPLLGIAPNSVIGMGTSNLYGMRFISTRAGTIAGLAMYIGTASGNINVGIYDTGTPSKTRLFQTGNAAFPGGAGQWKEFATPNLAVTLGQHIDLCCVADNNTAQVAFLSMGAGNPFGGPLPSGYLVSPQGGPAYLGWVVTGSPTIPATLANGSIGAWGSLPLFLVRYA